MAILDHQVCIFLHNEEGQFYKNLNFSYDKGLMGPPGLPGPPGNYTFFMEFLSQLESIRFCRISWVKRRQRRSWRWGKYSHDIFHFRINVLFNYQVSDVALLIKSHFCFNSTVKCDEDRITEAVWTTNHTRTSWFSAHLDLQVCLNLF